MTNSDKRGLYILSYSSITPDGPLTVFWRSDVGESQAATWIPIHTQICRGRILHADIVSMSDDEVNVIVLIRDDERRLDPEGQGLDLTNFREEVIAPDDVCIEYMVGRRNPSSSEVDPPSSFIVSQSYYALPLGMLQLLNLDGSPCSSSIRPSIGFIPVY